MNTVHDITTLETESDFLERCAKGFDPADDISQPPRRFAVFDVEEIQDIARRAYAAGCDAKEFNEEAFREDTDNLMREVVAKSTPLSGPMPEPVPETEDDAFWAREERVDRLHDLIAEAAKALVDRPDRVEIKRREIRIHLGGPSPLCIPVRALEGLDPRMAPAIVESYVEAYKSGVVFPDMSLRDFERIATLLDFAAARLVSKGDKEIVDFIQAMLRLSVKLAVAVRRAS